MKGLTLEKARILRKFIEKASISLTDSDALESVELFPFWVVNHDYQIDERVQDGGILYKCIQAHKSQKSWKPAKTPALWVKISVEEWPEWTQPAGAHDAYNTGDKVSHNEKHWISTMDANTYEPGIYGWEEVD